MTPDHTGGVRPIDGDRRFRMAFDAAAVGIALVDLGGRVVESNRALHAMLGYDAAELQGKTFPEMAYSPDLDGDLDPLADVLADRRDACTLEHRYRRKNGSVVWGKLVASVVRDAGKRPRYGVGFVADITAQKDLEDQLLQAQKLATVGRLVGGVVHDFNNLLTIIRSYSDFMIDSFHCGDDRLEHAEEIRYATDQAALLTGQLLACSRPRAKEPGAVDASLVVLELGRLLSRVMGLDFTLTIRVAESPCTVLADDGTLQQVLLNLAVNARDAMPGGGSLLIETSHEIVPRKRGRAPAESTAGERHVRIAVTDTGAGIPADVGDRVFDPFYTTKPPGQGAGLGLSTVYTIVKEAGGFVRLTSEPRRGTTFEVLLPAIDAPRDDKRRRDPVPLGRGTETVLLVESDAALLRLAERTLSGRGFRVIAASGGDEALRRAREFTGRIHAVISEIVLPGITGPTLVARLEGARPDIRVLFLSGHAGDTLARHGVNEDTEEVLRKPFSPDELSWRVRQILD